VTQVKERVRVPAPQVTEQSDQSDAFHTYCVHTAVLQLCWYAGFCPEPLH
jgi:hypothetical protein